MDTFEKIRALLAEQLDIDPAKITMESDIMSDFEADSLDIVDMVMTLEDELALRCRTMPSRICAPWATWWNLWTATRADNSFAKRPRTRSAAHGGTAAGLLI